MLDYIILPVPHIDLWSKTIIINSTINRQTASLSQHVKGTF